VKNNQVLIFRGTGEVHMNYIKKKKIKLMNIFVGQGHVEKAYIILMT